MKLLSYCCTWQQELHSRYLVLTNQTTIEFHINMSNGHAARRKGEVQRHTRWISLHRALAKGFASCRVLNFAICLLQCSAAHLPQTGRRNPYDLGRSRNFQEVQGHKLSQAVSNSFSVWCFGKVPVILFCSPFFRSLDRIGSSASFG